MCWEQTAGAFYSAQRQCAATLRSDIAPAYGPQKKLQPSPQHKSLQREFFGSSFALPLSYWPAVVDQVGFEPTPRRNSRLRHAANSCGGNQRLRYLSRCSAIELQRLSSPAGIEPATVGSRSNPSLHHAAIPQIFFFTSLLHYFLTSSSPHTPSIHPRTCLLFANRNPTKKYPGGIGAHGLWVSDPEPCGLLPQK